MKHTFFIFFLFVLYITITTFFLINLGWVIAPTRYLFVLLFGVLLLRRTRSFLINWGPFILLLISYDFLRAFTPFLAHQAEHWQIQLEESIFQTIPAAELQKMFFHPTNLAWYDYLGTVLYLLHFILPPAFGFLLWQKGKKYFREFVTGISLLSYAIWITTLLFPTIPPWMATQDGYLSGVYKVMDLTLRSFPGDPEFPSVYHNLNPSPTAAIPSAHTAYAFLVLFFALRFFKLKALIFLPYALTVPFFLIYLGEHYVVDIIAGVLYAAVFYILSKEILHRINWHKVFKR